MTAPIPARLFDSLANLTARLGVSGDKGFADTYVYNAMQPQELDAAYRTSWLARKIIDIPPFDMTREWRNWQAEGPQIEAIENEERRLKLIQKTRKGMTWGRLYGGAALVMGVKDGNKSSEPLELDRVKKGGFEYLHAVSMNKISVGEVESDPLSENYGAPKFYRLSGAVVGEVEIHWSRVIRFCGVELPDAISEINNSWGDPVWTSVRDAVRNADLSSMGIVSLLHEAKVDVINIPNLMDLLSNPEYEQRLFRRLLLAQTAKSINNTLLLDKEEVWSRKEVTFSGVVEVLRIFLAVAAGAGDIPATRLLGKSPDGMNATGDNDLRNYYDMLSSRQNLEMWPALAPLDEVLIRSALGSRPAEVYFESAPLWQMTPAEKADIDNKKADMVGKYAAQNLVPPDALAKAVQNMLIEDGTLPGLEQAIEESTEELNFDPQAAIAPGGVPDVPDPNAVANQNTPGAGLPPPPGFAIVGDGYNAGQKRAPKGTHEGGEFSSTGTGTPMTSQEASKAILAGKSDPNYERAMIQLGYIKEKGQKKAAPKTYVNKSGKEVIDFSENEDVLDATDEYFNSKAFTDSQEAALSDYTNTSMVVNGRLRGVEVDPEAARGSGGPKYVKTVDSAMSKASLSQGLVVYRGIEDVNLIGDVGTEFTDKGYASFSAKKSIADGFASGEKNSGGVVLRMTAPKGTKAIDMRPFSDFTEEAEILFPRDSKYRVVAKSNNVVDLELVK